ncbi:beta/alpha barrel domain-containing protein [Serratia ureilytica]|uniref:Terminase small subunit n=1 Tax=Serratia ureilytica TaxID=300181 RepID=A0A9X9BXD0_9GAMM|nr:hypothetical protein [Serratia ureilytica]TXE22192.1 hypothetical protein FOT63_25770 [Serratia ureilytica]
MARLDEFHERFLRIIEHHIRETGDRTDKGIGAKLGYHRTTIAEWRKKYPELQQVIDSPNARLNELVNEGLERNVTVGRTEVIKDADGKVKETRILSPTARDLSAAVNAGFGGTEAFNKKEEGIQRSKELSDIARRLRSGKISYLDAVDECEIEGLPIPASWRAREAQRILSIPRSEEFTAINAAQLLEASGLPVPRTLMLEVGKAINLPPPVMAEIADMSPEDAAEAYRKMMG